MRGDVDIDGGILRQRPERAGGPVASEAFAVVREGMEGKAGIGKVALYGREYLGKVQPRERGLIMYTLRHADEISLAKYLLNFGITLEAVVAEYRPNYLCLYLYELAWAGPARPRR